MGAQDPWSTGQQPDRGGRGPRGWEGTVGSEAFPWSFYLPYPGYPGIVLALRQGWGELIRATPLRLWFTQFDS